MGSLSSTPKIPQQQVVYTAAPISAPVPITTPEDSSTKNDASEAREKTLLARKRGRIGTIATSLRGFLSETNSLARKTLLGE